MESIGKYQILEELGSGAMGIVYQARDLRIDRLVALKVMNPGLLKDPTFQQRFQREAQSAGRLQHANIVTIFDYGEADGRSYIAMEFLEGQSLEEILLSSTPIALLTKLQWTTQICRGLDHAHSQEVVHRDIKPANIRVTPDGRVKIVDFGIARLAGSRLTGTGSVFGSPSYMSPEQARSSKNVDGRSDQFGVGIILFELLTGKLPFSGENIPAILFKIVADPHPRLEEVWPQAPPGLAEIVDRALAKNPEERFRSCGEMAQRLEMTMRRLQAAEIGLQLQEVRRLAGLGDTAAARRRCDEILLLDPANHEAQTLLDRLEKGDDTGFHATEGKLAEARQKLAVEDFDGCLAACAEGLQLDPRREEFQQLGEKAERQRARRRNEEDARRKKAEDLQREAVEREAVRAREEAERRKQEEARGQAAAEAARQAEARLQEEVERREAAEREAKQAREEHEKLKIRQEAAEREAERAREETDRRKREDAKAASSSRGYKGLWIGLGAAVLGLVVYLLVGMNERMTPVVPTTTIMIPPTTAYVPPTTLMPTTIVYPSTTAYAPPTTAYVPPTTLMPTTILYPTTTMMIPPTTARVGAGRLDLGGGEAIEFASIPAGRFRMGSENGDSDEKPVHEVQISRAFQLGKYEVTQGQWQAMMGANPSSFKNCGAECPVEEVSWNDVQQFIARLNARNDGWRYRLPTEAEWEYAARAGTTGDYAGNLDAMGWYDQNSGSTTHRVGQKQANAWGLYDMHGNVYEWCQDWYGSYSSGAVSDPSGATSGAERVLRGGGWSNGARCCRSAYRYYDGPFFRNFSLGLRLVRVSAPG